MKPSEQTKLAEKCAKFLGMEWHEHVWFHKDLGWLDNSLQHTFFIDYMKAPILQHLGKRRMEDLGYCWDGSRKEPNDMYPEKYNWQFERKGEVCPTCESWPTTYEDSDDDNEFIAFWKAVESTGVMDDK